MVKIFTSFRIISAGLLSPLQIPYHNAYKKHINGLSGQNTVFLSYNKTN